MGVVKDEAKAVRLFRHAAKLGAAEAGAPSTSLPHNNARQKRTELQRSDEFASTPHQHLA